MKKLEGIAFKLFVFISIESIVKFTDLRYSTLQQ